MKLTKERLKNQLTDKLKKMGIRNILNCNMKDSYDY